MRQHPTLIPTLRYKDAPAAIDFLCRAFGFERHAVYADDTDPSIIHHAQLKLDDSMIMLGTAAPADPADIYRRKTPAEARAKAAGAEIVTEPHANEGYPGRSYHCRDLEGNDWDFGTYDPWAE
jgi:uncharacterized glyoxalase superfamily protein PhnB